MGRPLRRPALLTLSRRMDRTGRQHGFDQGNDWANTQKEIGFEKDMCRPFGTLGTGDLQSEEQVPRLQMYLRFANQFAIVAIDLKFGVKSPHTTHHTPHTTHHTPHTSRLTPHTSHLTPHTSHLTPHTSHLTPSQPCFTAWHTELRTVFLVPTGRHICSRGTCPTV